MTTYDTSFHPLLIGQYYAAVDAGTMAGYTSPIRTEADYNALIAQSQSFNVDPRIPLAFCWAEGHMGSDPNLVAASVHNFGGIKWVGQPGASDSGIPADTGGTYAAFPDSTYYWHELLRTLTNEYVGPYLRAGDVLDAARKYTLWDNPHSGDLKTQIYEQMLRDYPVMGSVPAAVYGEDLIDYVRTLIGQAESTTETDPVNGVHPWAYWCESLAERVPEHFGLPQVRRGSAYLKMLAVQDQGFLQQGTPEHGAWVFFDQRFYAPDGHVSFWDADKGQVLGTVTDGTGIGYRDWGPQTVGFAGWARVPGVAAARRVAQVDNAYVIGGNPYGAVPMDDLFWARWDALNTMGVALPKAGMINPNGLALPTLGFPKAARQQLPSGRWVQQYERGWLGTQNAPSPFDIVSLMPEEFPK